MALCAEQSWDRASELLLGSTSLPAGEVWRGIRETILTNEIVLADKEDACKNYAKAKNHADLALHLALLKPTQAKQLIDALEKSGTMNFRLGVVMKSAVAEKRSRGSKIKQSELKKEKFFSDAEDCYKKADAILAELDDDFPDKKARQASLVMEIASTALVGKDDLAKAEEQFKEAVNLSKSIGNDKQAQFCLDRIADIAKMRAALPASNRGKNAN
jgi:tetratricopeptide (TPR) repeat protein